MAPLTPMSPSPRSPTTPPPTPTPAPNPLLETKPGLPESAEVEEEEAEEVEGEEMEVVMAVEEVGRVREGADSVGFMSVLKQGPNLFRQLPFFFFFTPSSTPPATAPPMPGPELVG